MSDSLVSLEDFYRKHAQLNSGEVILDVREPSEYQEAHLPGALNIPLGELEKNLDKLKSFKQLYIHCKRGGRAKRAFDQLKSLGLTNITCIHDAGIDAWLEKGYPVEKS